MSRGSGAATLALILVFTGPAAGLPEDLPDAPTEPPGAGAAIGGSQDPPFGASVRVVDDTSGAAQWEVSAAVNRRGALVAEWVDQRGADWECGWSSSTDGGATWRKNRAFHNPAWTFAADPVVVADDSGDFYMVCMGVESSYNGGSLDISLSKDDGVTWSPWVAAVNMSSGGFPDKPWMAARGNGELFLVYNENLLPDNMAIKFLKSPDGGRTWTAPRQISTGGSWAEQGPGIDLDAAGNIYIAWAGYNNLPVEFLKSTDGGATFTPKIKLSDSTVAVPVSGLAVDRSGTHVYLVWNSAYQAQSVFFMRSDDGGATWKPRQEISKAGTKASIDVEPSGRVHLVWEENSGSAVDVLHSSSDDHGASFSPPVKVSDRQSGCGAGTMYGSYEAVAVDDLGAVHAFWCDLRGGDADIYFARTPRTINVARLEVSPATATTDADTPVRLTATGYDSSGNPVPVSPTWSASAGSVDASGWYSPGPTGLHTVTASLASLSAQATVTVTPGKLASLAVSPSGATILSGQTLRFTAAGADSNGNPVAATPQWSASGGSIDGSGLFTGGLVGTFTVTASSGGVDGNAQVTVNAGALARIDVLPQEARVRADETLPFSAQGTDAHGNPVPASVIWSVSGSPDAGSIDSAGVYSPFKAGTQLVRASSGSIVGEASVEVVPGPAATLVVSPDLVELAVMDRAVFTASAADIDGNPVGSQPRWSVAGGVGSIDSIGQFVASSPGEGGVVAVIDGGAAPLRAEARVKVLAAPKQSTGPVAGPNAIPAAWLLAGIALLLAGALVASGAVLSVRRRRRRREAETGWSHYAPARGQADYTGRWGG
jgi:hypothetical protein